MKKALLSTVTAAVLLLTFSLLATGQVKTMTWKGWISDSECGVKGMTAEHKDCATTCIKAKGAKYVFVESESKKIIPIHNQDAVKDTDPGHEVKVTGRLMKDKSVHVDSIESAA